MSTPGQNGNLARKKQTKIVLVTSKPVNDTPGEIGQAIRQLTKGVPYGHYAIPIPATANMPSGFNHVSVYAVTEMALRKELSSTGASAPVVAPKEAGKKRRRRKKKSARGAAKTTAGKTPTGASGAH